MKIHHKLLSVFVCIFFLIACNNNNSNSQYGNLYADQRTSTKNYNPLFTKALKFCRDKNLNQQFFFLIDLSRHSGEYRFFVYDFFRKRITDSFLVSHGCGTNPWSYTNSRQQAVVSNQDGSHCSSLGKYELLGRAYSEWGVHIKYLMKGLEPSNKNALKRQIVFHSWSKIKDEEVFPEGTPEGWGCPAVSDKTFLLLDSRLKSSRLNTLMWIIQ